MMAKERAQRRSRGILLVLLGIAMAGGCYKAEGVNAFLQQPRSPVSGTEYRVLPPDVISITSTRVPEIDRFREQVRPDGKINLPLLGEVYVADKTPKEIEESVQEAARKYYEEVDAAVQVVAYNSRKFYVFGQVGRPGPMPWTGCDTLLDVLSQAQPTPLAWPERIVVIRGAGPTQGGYPNRPTLKYQTLGVNDFGGEPTTQPAGAAGDGEDATGAVAAQVQEGAPAGAEEPRVPQKLTVNLMAMVQHGDMAGNILLKPNDIIYVQANPFAKVSLTVEQVFMPVRAATDGLSDFRELMVHWKWIEDNLRVSDQEVGGRSRIIAR